MLACDEGERQKRRSRNEGITRVLNTIMRKIDRMKRRLVVDRLDVALNGEKRSRVYDRNADGAFEDHLVALSCGDPPEGLCPMDLEAVGRESCRT